MASVTAVSIERHAGDRLRMSDLRGVYDLSILISAAETELGAEVPYATMQEWLTVYRMGAKFEAVSSGKMLEERYGDELRRLAVFDPILVSK
jgi:hypothetical protein